jgi:hypothetical protein
MKVFAVVTFVGTERELVHAFYTDESEACFHAEDFRDDQGAKVFITEVEEIGKRVDLDEVHEQWLESLRASVAAEQAGT